MCWCSVESGKRKKDYLFIASFSFQCVFFYLFSVATRQHNRQNAIKKLISFVLFYAYRDNSGLNEFNESSSCLSILPDTLHPVYFWIHRFCVFSFAVFCQKQKIDTTPGFCLKSANILRKIKRFLFDLCLANEQKYFFEEYIPYFFASFFFTFKLWWTKRSPIIRKLNINNENRCAVCQRIQTIECFV